MSTSPNSSSATSSREKKLMIVAGIMLVFIVIPMLMSFYGSSVSTAMLQRNGLRESVGKLETQVDLGKIYEARLRQYTDRALPPDGESAKDWYRTWLYNQAVKHRFQSVDATDTSSGVARGGSSRNSKAGYQTYTFKLDGEASLEDLSAFLGDFYKAERLHLIRSLSINSQDQSNRLKITMSVETLALENGAKKGEISGLPMAYTDDSRKIAHIDTAISRVGSRKLFSAFRPPQPPVEATTAPQESGNEFTDAMYTFVTAIIEINGVYQAWVNQRLKGETLRLFVGDTFDVGGTRCVVREIHFNKIVVGAMVTAEDDQDGFEEMRLTIRVGKSFEECEEFGDDAQESTDSRDERIGRKTS